MNRPRPSRLRSDDVFVPPPGSNLLQCAECTILIGEGYQEALPYTAPDGVSIVCSQCYDSLVRRARRDALEQERSGG